MQFSQIEVIIQLFLAVLLGGLVGLERESKGKAAGFQTYSLVSMGACLFTVISLALYWNYASLAGIAFDPSRIVLAIATGIGFIGGGVIFFRQTHIEGITTASGLWCAAAIGVSIGCGFYLIGIFSAILVLGVLALFGKIETNYICGRKRD